MASAAITTAHRTTGRRKRLPPVVTSGRRRRGPLHFRFNTESLFELPSDQPGRSLRISVLCTHCSRMSVRCPRSAVGTKVAGRKEARLPRCRGCAGRRCNASARQVRTTWSGIVCILQTATAHLFSRITVRAHFRPSSPRSMIQCGCSFRTTLTRRSTRLWSVAVLRCVLLS